MTLKQISAVLLYLGAIVGPMSLLMAKFGLETTVALDNSRTAMVQLLAMAAAILSGVVISLIAGRLLAAEDGNLQKLVPSLLAQLTRNGKSTS